MSDQFSRRRPGGRGADPEPPGVLEGMTREEREDEFFRLLHTGCTVREAAKAVAVNFTTMYRKRLAESPEFAKRWEERAAHQASTTWWRGRTPRDARQRQAADVPAARTTRPSVSSGNRPRRSPTPTARCAATADSDRAARTAALLAMRACAQAAKEPLRRPAVSGPARPDEAQIAQLLFYLTPEERAELDALLEADRVRGAAARAADDGLGKRRPTSSASAARPAAARRT
jgi:hypothetical protein